ncbi:hypothetical protein BUALT_Bualt10G0075800 [Buddleja alternifolia]|uniref:Vacuolar protein sorting-associated protein 62 n=1 Tax=Buddleja alternifolia TaxID=168488 RepID=A0AAV6WXK1_9LAMI|nr:hypothetical protein BUALT_Bualt10G0075800 [Buddleja alternifolia]
MGNSIEANNPLPIDTIFKLPSPLPTWPTGGNFANGVIDLGGFEVRQISSFNKVWATYQGGPNNLGATFFEPSSIPDGFSMFGSYAQPNNQPLFGWVLVGKTDARDQSGDILKKPTDYTLVWANDLAHFWLPTPPDGYKPVGHVITTSPDKPSLDKIRCVRSDFTDEPEIDNWIWAQGNGLNVYGLRPKTRGTKAQPLSVGTFIIQNSTSGGGNSTLPLSCLKNKNLTLSNIPNLSQIESIFQTYSPYIYFHPKENYLPSSVNWYFSNGALLYKKGAESNPIRIEPNGTNLPQGGSNDGSYWLDLPIDKQAKEKVKKGDLLTAEVYLHVKPVLGATFTDIQVWLFYPFNGHATAKLGVIEKFPLGQIGEHVGDWEHVTLRISNFDGVLYRVYFAEHNAGRWVDSCLLEFQKGNKFVAYSSLNGHASYYRQGVVLQGEGDVGLVNEAAKSDMVIDSGGKFVVVAADAAAEVVAPPWLGFAGEWGPKISYKVESEVKKIGKFLIGKVKSAFIKLVKSLPAEVYGEEGPTGPKMKSNWNGDEI